MPPKHKIDRRRRPKQARQAAAPADARDENSSDDSSVDLPSPKKKAPVDSSDDGKGPPSDQPSEEESSGSDHDDTRNDNDDDAEPYDEEDKQVSKASAPKKKRLARSKAAVKRKRVKTMKRPPPKKTKQKKKNKPPPSDDELDDELPSSSGESEVSEFDPDEKDEESNNESDASWDSDEEVVSKKRAKRPPKRTTQRKSGRRTKKVESDDDSEASWKSSSDEKKSKFQTPRNNRRAASGGARRSTRRAAAAESSSNDDDSEYDESSPRRSTPARGSARRARARIHDIEEDENAQDDEEEEIVPKLLSRKKKNADEDEFDPDADEEDEESSSISSGEDEGSGDTEDFENYGYPRDVKVGNVDSARDFLTADSSSDDEKAAGPSTMLDVKYSRRRQDVQQEEDESDSSEDEIQPELSLSPYMPDCPSEHDAITMEKLQDKHICYFPPDQQTRQCFSLETLHKIAMNSSIRKHDGSHTFLQPPHFRAPASDDLIDQIASRFGRAALNLTGDFYKRGKTDFTEFSYMVRQMHNEDDEVFQEHLNNYISNLMGSQDVYCCPLCYVESHRRLANLSSGGEDYVGDDDNVESDEEGSSQSVIKLWYDPMTVLGFPDNDKYHFASVFCFSKVAEVKRHLREAHNVDTSILDNNDLFSRFKIRAGDGLLQRYIERTFKGRTFQGDMRRYWNEGNNQTFIYLLQLMKRRDRLESGEEDAEDEASTLFGDAQEFYESFENRAKQTWELLSAPYRKATREEIEEFIAEDDEEVEGEEHTPPHFAFRRDRDVNPEQAMIDDLKRRRRRLSGGRDSDDSSDDDGNGSGEGSGEGDNHNDEDDDDSEQQPVNIPGYYSEEEEEEEDEWVTSKLAKPRKRAKVTPSSATKSPVKGKRLGRARGKQPTGSLKRDNSTIDADANNKKPAAKKAKRRAIVDTDSD